MTAKKLTTAAKTGLKKGSAAGKVRRKPGTGPDANYYRIEVRPRRQFSSFRTQDVGKKGGIERIAGRRPSGSWDTQAWLVSKDIAHVTPSGKLVIDRVKDRQAIEKAISGKMVQLKSGIFKARPIKNIPEKAKPTQAMKRAQLMNIKKAQAARKEKAG